MKRALLVIVMFLCANVLLAQTRFTIDDLIYEVTGVGEVEVHDFIGEYDFDDDIVINIPQKVTNEETEYNVTAIGDSAFYSHSNIDEVILPNGIISIGNYGFYWCNMMAPIILPNSVKTIGDNAFQNCFSFGDFLIPENVTSIGNSAFSGCNNLQTIYFNATNCEFNVEYLVFPENVQVVNIGENVQSIPNYFVQGCDITNITIPNSVKEIGAQAFYGCSELTNVTIGIGVTSIRDAAFLDCNDLNILNFNATDCKFELENYLIFPDGIRKVNIGNNVKTIPDYFVQGCWDINSITLPESVTSIGMQAFYGCTSLTSITIPENVTSINNSAFAGCEALTTLNYNATDCKFNIDKLVFPENLEVVNIGENVKSIPDYFVQGCNISSITLNENVTTIGTQAFYNCSKLSNVISLAETPPTLKNKAFGNANKSLLVPCGSLNTYLASNWANYFDENQIEEDCDNIDDTEIINFSFYPNPTNGNIFFNEVIENVEIMDLTGRTICRFNNVSEVNIDNLTTGIYYLRMEFNESIITEKIIKK